MEILWLWWGPSKSELYSAFVLSQSSSASLVALLTDSTRSWEQQCLLCVSGELELFSVRKDSQSAIFVFTFHSLQGSWEVSPCAMWRSCFQSQGWNPKVKSSSASSSQGTVWCLKAADWPFSVSSSIGDNYPQRIFCHPREGVGEEEEE